MSKVWRPSISVSENGAAFPDRLVPPQRLLPLSPVPATPYVEQLSIGAGRRVLAISLAVLIPALLLLMLLSFGPEAHPSSSEEHLSMVSLAATEISDEAPKPDKAERSRTRERHISPQPAPVEQPRPEATEPKAPPTISTPSERAISPSIPQPAMRPPGGAVYGPPDTGGSSSSRDSQRVGTAPNGEPLYAAAWYREPRDDELRGYLSTASGPGWGLIACRTAPDYRVEDCVGLDEYPNGSQINRAVLAAAWAFKVRPPRLGGRPLVGAWVRIRIDYGL